MLADLEKCQRYPAPNRDFLLDIIRKIGIKRIPFLMYHLACHLFHTLGNTSLLFLGNRTVYPSQLRTLVGFVRRIWTVGDTVSAYPEDRWPFLPDLHSHPPLSIFAANSSSPPSVDEHPRVLEPLGPESWKCPGTLEPPVPDPVSLLSSLTPTHSHWTTGVGIEVQLLCFMQNKPWGVVILQRSPWD